MIELLRACRARWAMRRPARAAPAQHVAAATGEATEHRNARRCPRPPSADPLSERELQVLRLLASELSGPQIARQLFVSHNTLRTHTKHIFTKLDVTSRRAAVRRADERGLI